MNSHGVCVQIEQIARDAMGGLDSHDLGGALSADHIESGQGFSVAAIVLSHFYQTRQKSLIDSFLYKYNRFVLAEENLNIDVLNKFKDDFSEIISILRKN